MNKGKKTESGVDYWPHIPLGEVLVPRQPQVFVDPTTEYQFAGVYSFGRGVFRGVAKMGREFAYNRLTRLSAGDFTYPKLMAWEGAFGVVPPKCDGCHVSPEFPVFAPRLDLVDPRFLNYYFRNPRIWEEVSGGSTGTNVRRRRLHPSDFLRTKIALPALAEQRRIVARIEEVAFQVQEACALRHRAAEELRAIVPSETNALFNDGTHRWPVEPLENVSEIRSGVTLGRTLNGRTVRLPYLRVANVQDGHLNLTHIKEVEVLESESDKWKLQVGDLLLTEGGDWDKLGRGTVWHGEIPNCIHQNHIFRVRSRADEIAPEFLAKLISSPVGKAYFQAASKQTTNLASINQRQLKAFPVFRPPLPEQRRIVEELERLEVQIDALEQLQHETAAELDALLPSILDKAFKGEL